MSFLVFWLIYGDKAPSASRALLFYIHEIRWQYLLVAAERATRNGDGACKAGEGAEDSGLSGVGVISGVRDIAGGSAGGRKD
jgi:hypothetical protein